MAMAGDVYFMCSALVWPHGWEIFSVSRQLTSGESDGLLPGRTVSIGSDRVCLPTFNPLAPVNLLRPVLLIMRLALISGSGGDRTQSACEWTRSDSGRVDMCAALWYKRYLVVECLEQLWIHLHSSPSTVILRTLKWDQLPDGLIMDSVDRALHRYHRGHGFGSRSGLNFFSGFNFTTAQVVYITAMINHTFISFSAVQMHDLSYIHLQYKTLFLACTVTQ